MARQLTNRQAKRSRKSKGFTLIELMVVTAIAGVLGAVAVPKFLGAREVSEAKAAIAEVVGAGRECQNWISAGGTSSGMDAPEITLSGSDGVAQTCEDGETYALTLSTGTTFPDTGIICLGNENKNDSNTTVTVTASQALGLSCDFSGGSANTAPSS